MFELLSDIVVALVALLHVGFLVLEMLLWEHDIGLRVFRQDAARAAATRSGLPIPSDESALTKRPKERMTRETGSTRMVRLTT